MARAVSVLRLLVLAVAGAYLAAFLVVALLRAAYPFELEWMEGGAVDHVRWLLAGQRLYVKPSLDFVPFIYMPLYFYVAAGVAKVVGVGFLALRLVSIVSSIGCGWLVFALVRKDTKSRAAGVFAAGLFAAAYPLGEAFLDLARVDALFLVLVLGAVAALRFGPGPAGRAASGVLLALAFFTKQSAAPIALALSVHVLLEGWRRALWFVGPLVATGLAGAGLLAAAHGPWFVYYVFELPSGHPLVPQAFVGFWTVDIFRPFGVACFAAMFRLLIRRPRGPARLHAAFAVGAFTTAWSGRIHFGGWSNVLLPAFAALAILAGLALHDATLLARRARRPLRRAFGLLVPAACLLQLAISAYDPRRMLPKPADEAAGGDLVELLRAIDGDVYLPSHGHLPSLAGKPAHAHEWAIRDVLLGDHGAVATELRAELKKAAREKRFAAIIVDNDFLAREMVGSYVRSRDVFDAKGVFYPVTGTRTRPTTVYVAR